MIEEIWKDIINYEGLYQISNFGNIKSLKRPHPYKKTNKDFILKKSLNTCGYEQICLQKYNKKKTYRINRLVALHFLNNINNKPDVNHIDGNKLNNLITNLEWVTKSENIKHAYKIGLKTQKGNNAHNKKLTEEKVKEIRSLILLNEKIKNIAEKYNVSLNSIYKIKSNKTWNFN